MHDWTLDAENSAEARHQKRATLNAQRLIDYKSGTYALAGGVVDTLSFDAPFYVKDYYDYYRSPIASRPASMSIFVKVLPSIRMTWLSIAWCTAASSKLSHNEITQYCRE